MVRKLTRRRGGAAGFTLVELMVALTASLIVTFALARLVMSNQAAWQDGRDRAVLQQNLSEVLEWLGRDIRGAARVQLQGPAAFLLLDRNGQVGHSYALSISGGDTFLVRDGRPVAARDCPVFSVQANADTTVLTLTVGLRGRSGKRTTAVTAVAVRGRHLENDS